MNQSFSLSVLESKKQLAPIFRLINTSTVLPILENVLVQGIDNKMAYTTTDLETTTTVYTKRKSNLINPVCIHGRYLKNLIANSLSDEILFEKGKDETLCIKSGGFNLKINTETQDSFPKKPVISDFNSISVDAKSTIRLFKNALPFVSSDDLRPAMTGVNICDYNGKLHIVATDAHRLYWDSLIETPKELSGCNIIVSAKCVKTFLEMFASGTIDIQFNKNHIRFYQEDRELISRLIDAKYPTWTAALPNQAFRFDLKRKDFYAFIKMAEYFTNHSTYQTKMLIEKDSISFDGGDVDFSTNFDYKLPIYNSDCKIAYKTAMNIKLLKQLLKINEKDEYVTVKHSGKTTGAITIDDCALIMPLMINE